MTVRAGASSAHHKTAPLREAHESCDLFNALSDRVEIRLALAGRGPQRGVRAGFPVLRRLRCRREARGFDCYHWTRIDEDHS
jgi:hypothetical protein